MLRVWMVHGLDFQIGYRMQSELGGCSLTLQFQVFLKWGCQNLTYHLGVAMINKEHHIGVYIGFSKWLFLRHPQNLLNKRSR